MPLHSYLLPSRPGRDVLRPAGQGHCVGPRGRPPFVLHTKDRALDLGDGLDLRDAVRIVRVGPQSDLNSVRITVAIAIGQSRWVYNRRVPSGWLADGRGRRRVLHAEQNAVGL